MWEIKNKSNFKHFCLLSFPHDDAILAFFAILAEIAKRKSLKNSSHSAESVQ